MVKRAAHDGLDECSNHSGLKIIFVYVNIYASPSAGIGRQDDLKLRWITSWTFKSFLGYMKRLIIYNTNFTFASFSTLSSSNLNVSVISYLNADTDKISILNEKKKNWYLQMNQ